MVLSLVGSTCFLRWWTWDDVKVAVTRLAKNVTSYYIHLFVSHREGVQPELSGALQGQAAATALRVQLCGCRHMPLQNAELAPRVTHGGCSEFPF